MFRSGGHTEGNDLTSLGNLTHTDIFPPFKGEEEGDFVDPDTYMLHLTITALHTTGVPGSYIVFPKIVLESYTGWNTSVNAPDWTQWTAGRTVVFRQTREELLQFFLSVAPKQDGMDVSFRTCVYYNVAHDFMNEL